MIQHLPLVPPSPAPLMTTTPKTTTFSPNPTSSHVNHHHPNPPSALIHPLASSPQHSKNNEPSKQQTYKSKYAMPPKAASITSMKLSNANASWSSLPFPPTQTPTKPPNSSPRGSDQCHHLTSLLHLPDRYRCPLQLLGARG